MRKKTLLTLFFLIFSVICFVCVYHLYQLYKIDTPQQEKYGILICNSVYFLGIGSFLAFLYVYTKDEGKKTSLKNTDNTLNSKFEEDFGNFNGGTEYRAKVKHITEYGWVEHVNSIDTWVANSKEELFERMLKTNYNLRSTCESYEFKSHELMDEYDEWWINLSEERKAQNQGEDINTQVFKGRFFQSKCTETMAHRKKTLFINFLKEKKIYEQYMFYFKNYSIYWRSFDKFLCKVPDISYIGSAFLWGMTKEGNVFWDDISKEWRLYLKTNKI